MSGTPFVPPRFIPVSSTGRPYPAAKLFFYRAGTTTLATVYTDSALSVPSSNPLTANSAGMFSAVYLNPSAGHDYKAVLQTSAGVQLWSEDNIPAEASVSANSVGRAIYPRTQAEIDADVTPTTYIYPPYDVRRYGAVADAVVNGTSGTDSTAAIQTALDIPVVPVYIPTGNYLFTNLTIPSEKSVYGDGIHQTNLICKVGSTGTMFTDQGSAAKVTVRDLAFYGNNCAYTAGFSLGNNGTAYGTEGHIDNVWVRDLPAGFPGIDINGNVGHVGRLLAQDTGGVRIVGTANMVNQLQSYGAKGFTEDALTVGLVTQDVHVDVAEVEAPATGVVPVYLTGNTSIDALTVSLAASTTHSHLVEIGASATTWRVGNFKLYFASGTGATITNGNFKSGSLYFGGNASSKSFGGEGNYSSGMVLAGGDFGVKMQQLQSFTVRVTNDSGTLKHRIGTVGESSVSTNFAAKINGATTTLTATPTGTDSSTAFAAGAKISSASTNTLILDTANQVAADSLLLASVAYNNATAAVNVTPYLASFNVNGTTRVRLALAITNPTSGAAVAWSTLLGTNGYSVDLNVLAFLR